MAQMPPMLEVLFTRSSKNEDFLWYSFHLKPRLFFSDYHFGLGLKPVLDDFQHDFAQMTGEADTSVSLANFRYVCLYRERSNLQLSPWDWRFSCSPDFVTDLC